MSQAASQSEMVITKQGDKTTVSIRGPETVAKPAPIPEDAEFIGIVFKLGTFMPELPGNCLVDSGVHLPQLSANTFWMNGSAWEIPTIENVDVFINRLMRQGLLAHETVVSDALEGRLKDLSLRSVQRRFVRATGISHTAIFQIQRAHRALKLLQQGTPILDVVDLAGYSDQPHLTRALKRFMGQTPSQIQNNTPDTQGSAYFYLK